MKKQTNKVTTVKVKGEKEGKKMGRPTKYNPKFVDMVDDYLETTGIKERIFHKTVGLSSNTFERYFDVHVPKVESFSTFLGVSLRSLWEWAEKYPEFSHALDRIKKAQHDLLVDGMASGKINHVLGKLMLSSNHGYREKTDVTSDDKAIIPITAFNITPLDE